MMTMKERKERKERNTRKREVEKINIIQIVTLAGKTENIKEGIVLGMLTKENIKNTSRTLDVLSCIYYFIVNFLLAVFLLSLFFILVNIVLWTNGYKDLNATFMCFLSVCPTADPEE